MRASFIGIALAVVAAGAAHAAPPAPCTAEAAISEQWLDLIHQHADMAQAQGPLLDEIMEINAKAKDPDKPVGPQLSWQDLARFQELTTRLQAGRLTSYVLSARERDLRLALEMLSAVEARRAHEPITNANRDGAELLEIMQEAFAGPTMFAPAERGGCSAEVLLYERMRAASRLETAAPATPEDDYTGALNLVRLWLWASDQIFDTRQRDLATYPGDIEKLGTTMLGRISNFTKTEQAALYLWNLVDERYRSDVSLELEASAAAVTTAADAAAAASEYSDDGAK